VGCELGSQLGFVMAFKEMTNGSENAVSG